MFIAGTKDFPQDHLDDLKLPFDDTLKNQEGSRCRCLLYKSPRNRYGHRAFVGCSSRYKFKKKTV